MAIISTERGGNLVWECDDCGRWEYQAGSKNIRHSSRCDCSDEQPLSPESEQQKPQMETASERRARVRRGDWETAAEVHNEFGYGDLANRVGLDTDY